MPSHLISYDQSSASGGASARVASIGRQSRGTGWAFGTAPSLPARRAPPTPDDGVMLAGMRISRGGRVRRLAAGALLGAPS